MWTRSLARLLSGAGEASTATMPARSRDPRCAPWLCASCSPVLRPHCSWPRPPPPAASTRASAGFCPPTRRAWSSSTSRCRSTTRTTTKSDACLNGLIEDDARIGLVVFSDVAYELLPPGTPASHLRPMLRLLVPPRLGSPVNPWTGDLPRRDEDLVGARPARGRFSSGTRSRMPRSSSSATSRPRPTTFPRSCRRSRRIRQSDIELRVVGLGPSSDARTIFEGLLQRGRVRGSAASDSTSHEPPRTRSSELPLSRLLVLGALFFLALAAHERFARAACTAALRRACGGQRDPCEAEAPGTDRRRARLPGARPAWLAVMAADVARWRDALPAGDVRYRVAPEDADPGRRRPSPRSGMSRALLGARDDVELRQALRALRVARLDDATVSDPTSPSFATKRSARLEAVASGDDAPARRSRAAGLLGVLGLARLATETQDPAAALEARGAELPPSAGSSTPTTTRQSSTSSWLCSVARGVQITEAGGGADPTPGGSGAEGAGAGDPGTGY